MSAETVSNSKSSRGLLAALLILLAVLLLLFARSFSTDQVVFSNDGPLGANVSEAGRIPQIFSGWWVDLNWVGYESPTPAPNVSSGLRLALGPYLFAKFYPPAALFLLGMCAWFLFKTLRFHPAVCVLGGMAAALNGNFFSNACWGQGSRPLALAATFLALAALHSGLRRFSWIKIALAGMAVGFGVTEGFDVGAMFSLYFAAFLIFATVQTEDSPVQKRAVSAGARLLITVVFAGLIAAQTLISLVGTQITGVSGMEQTEEAKAARWSFATQWSTPKAETLRVLIPGLFGYRMSDEKGQIDERSYWGGVGQTEGNPKSRFSGSGENAGVLVALLAAFAIAQSFRKKDSPFSPLDRKFIWFWAGAALISLLLAWGKHAPFYQAFYALPYASTIRNPMKFMHPLHMALIILFGYGAQALFRQYVERAINGAAQSRAGVPPARVGKADPPLASGRSPGRRDARPALSDKSSLKVPLKTWWAGAVAFEKKWVIGCAIAIAASTLGWLLYASSRTEMMRFLETAGFNQDIANPIFSYSLGEVGVYVGLLVVCAGLVALIMSGWFAGARGKWGGLLLGLVLLGDLVRANTPWIIYWDAKEKYATNPVLDILRERAYLHRVTQPPVQHPQMGLFEQLYGIEWLQHHFQYYNIHSLDVIQEPRPPADTMAFRRALSGSEAALVRQWELTNTRFLLSVGGQLVEMLNRQLDSGKNRFRIHTEFDIVTKPHIGEATQLQDLTASPRTNGTYALIEFTGALPRARLYSNWQVVTNDEAVLEQLPSTNFDPHRSVLVSDNSVPAPAKPDEDAGTVEFVSYAPKHIELRADARTPAVLLLNDKFSPNWKVSVDGKPADLFRANYIMRGVYLEPGEHRVTFEFKPSLIGLYVSIAAIVLGIALGGILIVSGSRRKGE